MNPTRDEDSFDESKNNLTPDEKAIESTLIDLEKKGDSDEHDDELDIEEERKDTTDYSTFSKDDFIKKAEELIFSTNIKEAHDTFKKIRLLFDDLVKADRTVLIKEWADAGNDVREFKPPYDEKKDKFYKVYASFLEKRAEEKRLAEEEKQKNLKAKRKLIEELKELSTKDETETIFSEVLEIQKKWRQIRTIPRQHMQELWDNYRFYLDKFYDNHSINNELKEKDRQKNLEFKIELLKRVDLLKEEKSIKKTHILLNKYHEEFRNTGPVPSKEMSEDIWKRFKEASDEVLKIKRDQLDSIKAKRNQNYELKKLLCEKVETINQVPIESIKLWKEKADEIAIIFNEWKTIGPVPESVNDQIWKRFRDAQNIFNHNRKVYFDQLNKGKDINLKMKTELCEKAEKIAESTQFDSGAKELISLQEKWKSIGPVSENMNEKIWLRFRTACDKFFNQRNEFYKHKNVEEKTNQTEKETIINSIQQLLESEDVSYVFEELRKLQLQWNQIGYVPIKVKQDLAQNYSKAVDALYKKFKQASEENKQLRVKEHFELLASSPNGADKLKHEERQLLDKIRMLKENVETLNNNIGFFAKSKKADEFKLQIEQKINTANSQIEKLQADLKVLRTLKIVDNRK